MEDALKPESDASAIPISYYANQLYQYSFAKSIYARLGGTFIVRKVRRKYRFLWHFRSSQRRHAEDPVFKSIPLLKIINVYKKTFQEPGILISNSNTVIHKDHPDFITIFIGHGTGDKNYGGNFKNLKTYDYYFISGPKHLAKLKDVGLSLPEECLVPIGNPRFDEIVNNSIDKDQYLHYLGIQDRNRKTILYAPTWKWGRGTLHKYIKPLAKSLTPEYNLIIRLHYFDRKYIPYYQSWARWAGLRKVYFSNPANILTNDTMNDLAVSDLLISDTSSIRYEYLITNNPIIIIDNHYQDGHHMPAALQVKSVAEIVRSPEPSAIRAVVERAFSRHDQEKYRALLNQCFYFNDGQSLNRIIEFITGIKREMG